MEPLKNVQKAVSDKWTFFLEVYSLKNYCLVTEETIPRVKNLLCKQKDLSLDPRHPYKTKGVHL